jgi:hypothetical protein
MESSAATPDRYELVCQSAHGAIQRCRCCGAVRVRFGNIVLGLDDTGFQTFCDVIAATRRGEVPRDGAGDVIPRGFNSMSPTGNHRVGNHKVADESVFYLGDSGLGFVVTRAEVEELDELVQRASFLMTFPAWQIGAGVPRLYTSRTSLGGSRHA